MTELSEALRHCAAKVEKYRGRPDRPINEANTKASLIEVVLRALGWDTADTDEVDREYRQVSRHNPTDYALLLPDRPDRPCAVVEAKALGTALEDPRNISQALGYATDSGAPCAVITDGDAWHLYDAHATEPSRERLYRAVRVSDDVEAAAEVLSLLTKPALRTGALQAARRSERADRQLKRVLRQLFDTGRPDHRKLLGMLQPLLPDLSGDELRDALTRLRPEFSFERWVPRPTSRPAPSPPPAPSPAGLPHARADGPRGASRPSSYSYRPVSETEGSISIHDLMAAKRLFPGRLTGTYKGETYVAELLENGTINHRGAIYTSLSSAAMAAKRVNADRGWNWWYTENHVDGDRVTLLEVRRRYAELLDKRRTERS